MEEFKETQEQLYKSAISRLENILADADKNIAGHDFESVGIRTSIASIFTVFNN